MPLKPLDGKPLNLIPPADEVWKAFYASFPRWCSQSRPSMFVAIGSVAPKEFDDLS